MNKSIGAVVGIFVGTVLGCLSAFLVCYEARLLYVTRGLTAIRTGGQGAYIGAIVFPLVALLLGWFSWRCFRIARKQ